MFFYLSKFAWAAVQPTNLMALTLVFGCLLALGRWRRTGLAFIFLGTIAYVAIMVFSAGQLLIAPLENRFAANPEISQPPDGILLLGGPLDSQLTAARQQLAAYDGTERYLEFIRLMRLYPEARGVISGGNPSLTRDSPGQASHARTLLENLGFDISRVTFETQARNTLENVVLSAELVSPLADERWIVVTSAYHMPRAMGVLRHHGWEALPWPVDFRTEGPDGRFFFTTTGGEALEMTDLAAKEWLGLAVYYFTGRSAAFFPGP
jgi:uncharacterized SAM-binding protein YcdF (DUF218 family)